MYLTQNHDEIYFLLDLSNNSRIKIGDKQALIKKVARMIAYPNKRTYWLKSPKWDEARFEKEVFKSGHNTNVFEQQNLTGTDCYNTYKTVVRTVYDDPDDETTGRSIFTQTVTKYLRPYVFYTERGAIFDIRLIINDVKMCLLNGDHIPPRKSSNLHIQQSRRHVTYGFPQRFAIREYKTQISCEEQGVHYRKKALPRTDKMGWWDENPSRRSSGWKDKRFEKQWEHNLQNKNVKYPMGRHQFKDATLIEEHVIVELNDQLEQMLDDFFNRAKNTTQESPQNEQYNSNNRNTNLETAI